ncbi:uncharacterized protein [Pyxicephalus adspersus]|uniref:uncharacterized protein isoform X2 n=1 Tax=Pyxicephalus adspersus TaxID=30357 RepID=UPI003B5C908F
MEFLFVLGLIGAEIITVGSNDLPAPELSSPSTSVYKGQSLILHCTAPSIYPEGIFYLYSENSADYIEQKSAPETKNSVTFTLQPLATDGTTLYFCVYHWYVQDMKMTSQASNMLNVTVVDQPPPSTGSTDLTVPLWVIFLVSGLVGFAILVAFVSLIVCLRQRCKQKKQEQRDKESIWINQNMEKDWTLSRNNKVFPIESTIETELSHPTLSNKNSYSYAGTSTSFSSFRT